MSEYQEHSLASLKPIEISGLEATVLIGSETVTLSPNRFEGPSKVNEKVEKYDIFNQLTQHLPNLKQPKILKKDPVKGIFEMEKAIGIPLEVSHHNKNAGGYTDFFIIPPEIKYNAAVTYLKAIVAIHSAGYAFMDHKCDSVFLNPETGAISIVDTGGLIKHERNNLNYRWREEINGGIGKVLKSFFTREFPFGRQNSKEAHINMLATEISNIESFSTAEELVGHLESRLNKGPRRDYYGFGNIPVTNQKVMDYIRVKKYEDKLSSWIKDIEKHPKPHLSIKFGEVDHLIPSAESDLTVKVIDFDFVIAKALTLELLQSEEPQLMDKYGLGIES